MHLICRVRSSQVPAVTKWSGGNGCLDMQQYVVAADSGVTSALGPYSCGIASCRCMHCNMHQHFSCSSSQLRMLHACTGSMCVQALATAVHALRIINPAQVNLIVTRAQLWPACGFDCPCPINEREAQACMNQKVCKDYSARSRQ